MGQKGFVDGYPDVRRCLDRRRRIALRDCVGCRGGFGGGVEPGCRRLAFPRGQSPDRREVGETVGLDWGRRELHRGQVGKICILDEVVVVHRRDVDCRDVHRRDIHRRDVHRCKVRRRDGLRRVRFQRSSVPGRRGQGVQLGHAHAVVLVTDFHQASGCVELGFVHRDVVHRGGCRGLLEVRPELVGDHELQVGCCRRVGGFGGVASRCVVRRNHAG